MKQAKFPEPLEVPSSSGLNIPYPDEPNSRSHTLVSDRSTYPCHQEIVDVWYLPPSASRLRLEQFFAFAGRIKSIQLFPENANAVVTFVDVASANRLLKRNFYSGFIIAGFRLSMDARFDDAIWNTFGYTSEKIVISNIPHSVSKTKLQRLFSYAGRIMSIDIFPEDFHAVITYDNVVSASTVRASGRHFYLDEYLLCVFSEEPEIEGPKKKWENDVEFNETELYIGHIPNCLKEFSLHQMFSGYGKVVGLNIIKDNHGKYGFVKFQTVGSAQNLFRNSRNKTFTNLGILEIERVQKD